MSVGYPYTAGHPLEHRFSYAYRPYEGEAFLDAWRAARTSAVAVLESRRSPEEPPATTLSDLAARETAGDDAASSQMTTHLRRFETSGRIIDESATNPIRPFIDVATAAARRVAVHGDLGALNVLLKANDVICAHAQQVDPHDVETALAAISAELTHVADLDRRPS